MSWKTLWLLRRKFPRGINKVLTNVNVLHDKIIRIIIKKHKDMIFPKFKSNVGILCEIVSIPHNIVMDLNNVTGFETNMGIIKIK